MHTQFHITGKSVLICFGVLVLCSTLPGSTYGANGWSDPVPISGTIGSSYNPHLAIDSQGTLHAVWYDWVDLLPHNPYILYASKPPGSTWTPYSYVGGVQTGDMPAIAIGPDDRVHIVWASADYAEPNVDGPIKYISRAANGVWSTVQVVSASLKGNSNPDVTVAPNGAVHVAWNYGNTLDPTNRGIYHAMKPKNGAWQPPIAVKKDSQARNCLLGVDPQSTVHLVMNGKNGEDNVARYTKKTTASGWSTVQSLAFTPTIENVEQFTHDDQGNLHLVWGENDYATKCRLYYAHKPAGKAWAGPIKAVEGSCEDVYVYAPSVAINHQGLPVAVWTSRLYQNEQTMYSAWFAYSVTPVSWSLPILIDDDLEVENASSLAVEKNGNHHFVRDSGPAPAYTGEIMYYTADETPEPPVTAIITPGSGGTLQSSSGDVRADFPPGAVTEDVEVTYSKGSPTAERGLIGMKYFHLTARKVSDDSPVTAFEKDYTLTVSYAGYQPANEPSLGLYFWDGGQWLLVENQQLETTLKTVTASLDHMTLFALFSQGLNAYLPIILH